MIFSIRRRILFVTVLLGRFSFLLAMEVGLGGLLDLSELPADLPELPGDLISGGGGGGLTNNDDHGGLNVTLSGILDHVEAFQSFADNSNNTRGWNTAGFNASGEYVLEMLRNAGYDVTVQEFGVPLFEELGPSELVIDNTSNNQTTNYYVYNVDFVPMTNSPPGVVTALSQQVQGYGCVPSDYSAFVPGRIAIIPRGTCQFVQKAAMAETFAGAVGVVIYNNNDDDVLAGGGLLMMDNASLNVVVSSVRIPVLASSNAVGLSLVDKSVTMVVNTSLQEGRSFNILAETRGGDDSQVILAGAHLDSFPGSPGMNDNGSSCATLLEMALKMTAETNVNNKVQFAWWGAKEAGLAGSFRYLDQLNAAQRAKIAMYLNFDMIASPNYIRAVYSATSPAEAIMGNVFRDYFELLGLPTVNVTLGCLSDSCYFQFLGIPVGGLFTGASGIKTAEEVDLFGGTAGIQHDPCYQLACDTIDNLNVEILDEMADAIVNIILNFAARENVDLTAGNIGLDPDRIVPNSEYRGHQLVM